MKNGLIKGLFFTFYSFRVYFSMIFCQKLLGDVGILCTDDKNVTSSISIYCQIIINAQSVLLIYWFIIYVGGTKMLRSAEAFFSPRAGDTTTARGKDAQLCNL